MAPLKILISGAGIAGNALAFWLSKVGHKVTIIERFSTLRATGLQVDLRGHGVEVLRRMGLEEAFRAKSIEEEGLAVVDSAGRRWAFFGANRSGKGLQGFSSEYEIMRGDFCRLLHDATKDKATYIFGKTIESFEQKEKYVDVLFSDGKRDQFDLVVGADGQGSRTRKEMVGPGNDDGFRSLGPIYVGYFTMPDQIKEGEKYIATSYMTTNRRYILTRRAGPDAMQVYLFCRTPSEKLAKVRRGDIEREKEGFTEIFKGAGWKTDSILKGLADVDDWYCERMGLVKLDSWSRGRVSLVGDAAYCPSANTGMGTTSSIVGAYILAGEISKHCGRPGDNGTSPAGDDGLDRALKAYEDKFRPFMDTVQKGLAEDSGFPASMPSSAVGIWLFNALLGVASFLRLNYLGRWILREDVGDCALPNYPEMVKN